MVLGDEFERVLTGARRADQHCVAELYRDLNARLVNYLQLKAPGEAEDLASETWIAVGRNVSKFTGDEDAFRRWFFTIAHRQVTTHYRKMSRRKTDPVESSVLEGVRRSPDVSDVVTEKIATGDLLRRLTSLLPPDQADVVRLRVAGGFSMEEIGEIIGKRSGTVRVLFHRALARLAREMEEHPGALRPVGERAVTP